uniref:Glycerophosphoryl diester phosphodiesterase membrane domain-containing protein n=1 Tax=Pyrococcus abyssi (strain GE5 / Orsay) TaxID=272844 RepID=G8ZJM1_PYRAB|nr:TPA: hypothetical protein PAB0711 [Pyrococcus abyssi GE5]
MIIEKHGAISDMKLPNLKLLLLVGLLQLLLLSAVQYSIIHYVKTGSTMGEAFLKGLENVIQMFLLNVISTLIVLVAFLIAIFPPMIIVGIGGILESTGAVIFGILLVILSGLIIGSFAIGMTSVIVPAYFESNSLSKALGSMGLTFKRKLSTLGFGLLLLFSVFVFLLAIGIVTAIPLLLSRSLAAVIVARILEAPFLALLHAFTTIASLMFYENLKEEVNLLNLQQSVITDVRADRRL